MEFMPVNIHGEICRCDVGSSPPNSPGVQGRYEGRLPMGLHLMFWCFVAVLCGTLQLSSGASTVPNNNNNNNNSTSLSLTLTVPREHLYSKKARLVWIWHPYEPSPEQIMNYYITYQQEGSNSKTVITVDSAFATETLRNLEPNKPYRAFVKAVFNSSDVPFLDSALTHFETPEQIVTPPYEGKPGLMKGLVILAMSVSLWVVVVLLFWRQWRIIRQLEPTPSTRRFRAVEDDGADGSGGGSRIFRPYEPENIGSIRVVEKVKDSQISGGSPKRSSLKPAWPDIDEEDDDEEMVASDDEDSRLKTTS